MTGSLLPQKLPRREPRERCRRQPPSTGRIDQALRVRGLCR
jgi:hypothetical protein